jgi:lysozyme
MSKTLTLIESVMKHEGWRSKAYKCTAGVWTIGYGFAIRSLTDDEIKIWAKHLGTSKDALKGSIKVAKDTGEYAHFHMDKETGAEILEHKLENIKIEMCKKLEWAGWVSTVLQNAMIEWIYQLGINGVLKFTKTLGFIEKGMYMNAIEEVKKSAWYKQTPKRVETLISALKYELEQWEY